MNGESDIDLLKDYDIKLYYNNDNGYINRIDVYKDG